MQLRIVCFYRNSCKFRYALHTKKEGFLTVTGSFKQGFTFRLWQFNDKNGLCVCLLTLNSFKVWHLIEICIWFRFNASNIYYRSMGIDMKSKQIHKKLELCYIDLCQMQYSSPTIEIKTFISTWAVLTIVYANIQDIMSV